MVKDNETVIEDFNKLVSMTADELETGREIIEILKKNPKEDPSKYDEEDLGHTRKVVSYNKRHLAQEEKSKRDANSKSYKSLKNWGHDVTKA
ncbi:hypothetical protein MMC28_002957 [Mycoblastus sanguinarius]|nr:hypothetical protein [Mycoblastus sanguinarius]